MRAARTVKRLTNLAGFGALTLAGFCGGAWAGGFDIHEQSTVFMGMTSAGAAAGGSIGSMYWNPAAAGQFSGINTESSYTLVSPHANVDVDTFNGGPPPPGVATDSGDIGILAVTSASYGTYQISKDLWLGMSITSPFGLMTKPDDTDYVGNALGLTAKLLTVNASPTLAYRIAPGITIGAGVQIEYARAKVRFAEGVGPGAPVAEFKGDDVAFGGTAGILVEPAPGTSIGLGYRSQMTHDLGGHLDQPVLAGTFPASATLNLPDMVTLSARQVVAPNARLLGTIEWTNWSRFKDLPLTSTGVPLPGNVLTVPANWRDGWFFSIGGEYDYCPWLTLRTGVAYEISPEGDASSRLTQIPDNNRIWASVGASYKYSEWTTLDIGYSHIFVEDGSFNRQAIGFPLVPVVETGTIQDASADLFSVGMRTRW